MANAPDDKVFVSPNFQQKFLDNLLVTPTSGTQDTLANHLSYLNGGSVVAGSVGANLTATGSTFAGALTLTNQINNISSVAASTGVVLPSAAKCIGLPLLLLNTGTAAVTVYGQGGDTIDTTAGTTGVTLTNAHRSWFTSTKANTFISGPSGTVTS